MVSRKRTTRPQRLVKGSPRTTDLQDFIDGLSANATSLGLTHTTSAYYLRDILKVKYLSPRHCKVFSRPLVYTFYGRASYRKEEDEEPSSLTSVYPVVFILDPSVMPKPSHVYPFDTGAFDAGTFADAHDPYVLLENFELTPSCSTASRIVENIFGSNESYMSNKPRNSFPIADEDNYEAKSYEKIIRSPGQRAWQTNRAVDDRSSAIEIAFSEPVAIDSKIAAVIIPEDLVAAPRTGKVLRDLGILVLSYRWTGGAAPRESYEAIRDLVRGVYIKKGWM